MSNYTTTPNMNLLIPTVGVDPGPDYANNVNADFTILDQHDHSPGAGVQITPAGLNINTDLSFQNNNLTTLRSLRLSPQLNPITLPSDVGCLYLVTATSDGSDLWFNTGNGTQIQITKDGALFGVGNGSIANLVAPASASYSSSISTFIWESNANTPANLDAGYIILRNNFANSKGLTLQPPAAMAADYALTLPNLPLATSFLTIDPTGTIAPTYTVASIINPPRLIANGQPNVAPISGSRTAIVWPTTILDTASAYNNSTGIFTAPKTGYYDIVAQISGIFGTTGDVGQIFLMVNGTDTATALQRMVVGENSLALTVLNLQLTLGDQVKFELYNSGMGSYTVLAIYSFLNIKAQP